VPPDDRTPDRIRAAVQTVLSDHRYKARAQAFQLEMASLPAVDHAVHLLETLVASPRSKTVASGA
jgi:UDP:flavonoid glycosyltransferase YjiC (YdhE family)